MLLYKTTYEIQLNNDKPAKRYTCWNGSAKDSGAKRKQIRQTIGFVPNSIKSIKFAVPTDKTGLLKFLNSKYEE